MILDIKGINAACSHTKKIALMFPGIAIAIYFDFSREKIFSMEVHESGQLRETSYAGPEHDTRYADLFCVAHRPITMAEISRAFVRFNRNPQAEPVHYIKEERK